MQKTADVRHEVSPVKWVRSPMGCCLLLLIILLLPLHPPHHKYCFCIFKYKYSKISLHIFPLN